MDYWHVGWKGKYYKYFKRSDTNVGKMSIPKEISWERRNREMFVYSFAIVEYETYAFPLSITNLDSSTYDNLLANALSLSTTQSADMDDELFMDDPIHSSFKSPIKTYVHVYRGGFCGRGNTTASYNELNRYVSNSFKENEIKWGY